MESINFYVSKRSFQNWIFSERGGYPNFKSCQGRRYDGRFRISWNKPPAWGRNTSLGRNLFPKLCLTNLTFSSINIFKNSFYLVSKCRRKKKNPQRWNANAKSRRKASSWFRKDANIVWNATRLQKFIHSVTNPSLIWDFTITSIDFITIIFISC